MSSLEEIESVYNDTKRVLQIMKLAKRSLADFQIIQCKVLHGEIIIPKRYRGIVMKLFKKQSVKIKLVGEEFNNWLKQFLHTQVSITLTFPNISHTNYYDLFNFLERGKIELNNRQNHLLLTQCMYGYCLELFYQTYVIEHLSGRVTQTFKIILRENFGISENYGCKLRWLGRLWNQYPKIGQLSMSLSQFYSYRKQVDSLFKTYSHLADEWKIQENYSTTQYSSTNPFINQCKNPFLNESINQ